MNQGIACAAPSNVMSVSNAAEAIEGQQGTMRGMLNQLEGMLFGTDTGSKSVDPEPKCSGIEARLSNSVSTNERLLTQLDRILSRL